MNTDIIVRDWTETIDLAKECMFEEITIYGAVEQKSIEQAVTRKLDDSELALWFADVEESNDTRKETFLEAVHEAILFSSESEDAEMNAAMNDLFLSFS